MTKFKKTTKLNLALFTMLQLGIQANASEAVVVDLPPFESAIEEIGEVFDVFKIADEIKSKFITVYEERFKNLSAYPDMSLSDLGDEIIEIIDMAEELPIEIRENLKKLVAVKKMANSITEIKAPHPLISEILIQLANFKLTRVNEGLSVLLKHFKMQDVAKINQEILIYRNSVEKSRTRKIYKSIDDISTDLKKIGDKINLILKDYPLFLSFKTRYLSEEKATTALDQAAENIKLLKIFNYRIAQNKRKK